MNRRALPSPRLVVLGLFLALAVQLVPQPPASAQLGWSPISASDARLRLDPGQFPGEHRIRRFVVDTLAARFERATTGFDPSDRFFHVMLRESALAAGLRTDDFELQDVLPELWPAAASRVSYGTFGQVRTQLGEATYQLFEFVGYRCAVFAMPFGLRSSGDFRSVVRGFFCDPNRPFMDQGTVQAALTGIFVPGY